ncbi:MAG: helix-turn-helix domain-containing protein [Pseudomonadota bacterium]
MGTRAVSAVLLSDAPKSCITVALVLAHHANRDGLAWPSQETLSRESRASDRAVRRQVLELDQLNIFSRHRQAIDGDRRRIIYRLNPDLLRRADALYRFEAAVPGDGVVTPPEDPDIDPDSPLNPDNFELSSGVDFSVLPDEISGFTQGSEPVDNS